MVNVITDPDCTGYAHPGHPERPERISRTIALLRKQSAVDISWLSPDACPDEAILRAHISDHIARLQMPRDFDSDTPYVDGILDRARVSVGAAIKGLELVLHGQSVFSLMRPPGHHATKARAMGFCYLNNAAIAALAALARGVRRVAVFDFDVHHGNGTEAILVDVPGAAFFSVHQFPCYPGTGTRNVGSNCFNYPVPPKTQRSEYRHILLDALEHMGKLDPALVIVSAGFDAFVHDPLGQQMLELEDYHWLGSRMKALSLPALHLLEGGYSEQLPELIHAYLAGTNGAGAA